MDEAQGRIHCQSARRQCRGCIGGRGQNKQGEVQLRGNVEDYMLKGTVEGGTFKRFS